MAKELVVSSTSHETKVAILEDNQVVEAYFERQREYSLAGSIYKGRVTRVLPGMQSAFVEIGLERDAFLYVSDFFEDVEEYDKIVTSVEDKVIKMEEVRAVAPPEPPRAVPPPPVVEAREARETRPEPPTVSQTVSPEPFAASEKPPERPPERASESDRGPYPPSRRGGGGRHRRSRRRGFPDSKYSRHQDSGPPPRPQPSRSDATRTESGSISTILPGESLAKYRDRAIPSEGEPSGEAPASGGAAFAESAAVENIGLSGDAFPGDAPPRESEMREELSEPEIPMPFESAPPAAAELSALPQESYEPVTRYADVFGTGSESPAGVALDAMDREPGSFDESLEPAPSLEAESSYPPPEEVPPGTEAAESTVQEQPSGEAAPRQAVVREGNRNPRYQRRSRWGARRGGNAPPEAPPPRSSRPRERFAPAPQIADLLKEGQEIIVQIAKEPLGKKGARITSHIALPGRYLVYMPTVSHVGVSHKIGSDEERLRLKRIIQEHSKNIPGGFIVRTAGEGRTEEELRQDIQFLANLWSDIRAQAEKSKAPALLHHDLDLIQRIVRDQLSPDFTAVWVDSETDYERLVNWVGRFQPSLVGRVKLYTKSVPLFEQMGVQEEIDKALKPKVWLKSGGYIVINQTEALVAIDVNTGKFVGRSSRLEDTIVKTNVDAIQEIVRQIRLRDLGGIIVVDFIDMDERKNRHKVMAALEEALRSDRSPSKMLSFNEFGLIAITRKRVKQSLERTLGQPCPHCTGSGFVKSPFTVCCEIYTEARKMASELEGKQVTLRVNPEVGKALKARDNTILAEIEEMLRKPVVVRNDPNMHSESFAFE